MTQFIGISFGVIDNKITAIADSQGNAVSCEGGLSAGEVLNFLWSLRLEVANVTPKPAFVAFEMSIDWELTFNQLEGEDKNKLFGIRREREESVNDIPLYDPRREHDVVEFEGFRVYYLTGKLIRISEPGCAAMALYDISSYFESEDLSDAAQRFLDIHIDRVERTTMPLFDTAILEQLSARCNREAEVIASLGERIETTIEPAGLAPKQWYGPSAIAAKALNKWGARRQGKRLDLKNSSYELVRAVDCAYFGGRVEAVKLGTIQDVRVFDLNSAYAYATTLLSQFHRPLRYSTVYDPDSPFAIWYVDYNLPDDTVIGVLPTRSPSGGLSYRKTGRGYYWQPEVEYLRQRYPDCVEVAHGFVGEYEQVSFAPDIHALYNYRMELKANGDEGQTLVKLALSNLYGKFAQNKGGAYFQCRAWAGWITSFIRRLLLEAVTGAESSVICFSQDAVHFEGIGGGLKETEFQDSNSLGTALGAWKLSQFPSGLYLSPGIYSLKQGVESVGKQANCGSNLPLDYQRIASDLSNRQVSELNRAFFVGWNLAQQSPVQYQKDYLLEVSESLSLIPSRLRSRNYVANFDWATENRSSVINSNDSGLASSRYYPQTGQSDHALHLRLKDRGWA